MSRRNLYLVGVIRNQILGSKLPSLKDCLSVLFYNIRILNMTVSDAAHLVIDECLIFWRKARIPTKDRSDCVKKLMKVYEKWINLMKSSKRKGVTQIRNENKFVEEMNGLFDIAHANALNLISIEEDKLFLIEQRKPNRVGSMAGIDSKLSAVEKRKAEREKREQAKRQKSQAEMEQYRTLALNSSSSDEDISEVELITTTSASISKDQEESSILNAEQCLQEPSTSDIRRGQKSIMTPRLSAALDKCKVSDRDAVHLLSACLEGLSLNPRDYVINRSSIRRNRQQHREEISKNIESEFLNLNTDFAVVHWDTKLLPNVTGMEKVDRLPVIVKTSLTEQLLGVPFITSGSGREISSAVFDTLDKWALLHKVQAFVFDTTASNTGKFKGACTLLEMKLERNILFLACRHHMFELVLKAAIEEVKLYPSTGPDIALFKKFKTAFPNINVRNISDCDSSSELLELIGEKREEILSFCHRTLKNDQQPRNDYKEFLELVVILLGGTLPNGNNIRQPDAYHQARWMAKAIYSIKIYLLRNEFTLTEHEQKSLCRICGFIVVNYIRPWFSANKIIEAPYNDLSLLKSLNAYREKDPSIAKAALKKFVSHLWYLADETVLFSLWDDNVSIEEKQRMAEKLRGFLDSELLEDCEDNDYVSKKYKLNNDQVNGFLKKDLPSNLITNKSVLLFRRFKISTSFLYIDACEWSRNEDYKIAKEIFCSINVVNDCAERGIKLMEEFNSLLTKNENQKQFILQVVKNYREKYPAHTKKALSVPYNSGIFL